MPEDPTIKQIYALLAEAGDSEQITPELTRAAHLVTHELHQPIVLSSGITTAEMRRAIEHSVLRSVLGVKVAEARRKQRPSDGDLNGPPSSGR